MSYITVDTDLLSKVIANAVNTPLTDRVWINKYLSFLGKDRQLELGIYTMNLDTNSPSFNVSIQIYKTISNDEYIYHSFLTNVTLDEMESRVNSHLDELSFCSRCERIYHSQLRIKIEEKEYCLNCVRQLAVQCNNPLKCPICNEDYEQYLRYPKALECNHSICIACARSLLLTAVNEGKSPSSARCPLCRRNIGRQLVSEVSGFEAYEDFEMQSE